MNWQVIQSFTKDSGEVKGKTLSKKDIKRIWQFARPYKNKIIFFICALFVGAIIDVIPAMLFRKLLDEGLPTNTRPGDLGLITVLSILYVEIGRAHV